MARSDLLIQLVQSGTAGDRLMFRQVLEAIIAEERSKQHNGLADKLQENLSRLNAVAHNNSAQPYYNLSGKTELRGDQFINEMIAQTRISDLVLTPVIETTCRELIAEQQRSDLLRSYNLEPRHRVLFVGPPGNGKTSLAEAIASELMVPFFTVKYENIIASYLGETSNRLKQLFEYVKTRHCVVFFDEFDSIGKERGDRHDTGEIKRLVSSLLLQIDQLPSYVIVIAATNHPELLDRAVWRRFQVKVSLTRPTSKSIQQYLQLFQSQHNVSFGIQLNNMAKYFSGLSFSEVRDLCLDILRTFVLTSPLGTPADFKKLTLLHLSRIKTTYKPATTKN